MNESHTETVIIPHPNEMKKLTDLQKAVLCAVQERAGSGELWIPTFPLYVRRWTGAGDKEFLTECVVFASRNYENTEKFKEESLATWGKRIIGCTLTELWVSDDGECIFLTAEIATQMAADTQTAATMQTAMTARTKTLTGTLTLVERLRTNGENAGNSGTSDENASRIEIKGNTSVSIGLDPIRSRALPLRLPVFRVARVEFVHDGTRTEWTVQESAWVKRRK